MRTEQAVLGGGCFWCLDAVYRELRGVTRVESGYAGGDVPEPTYEQVCSGTTGHIEVVRITFDPEVVSYRDLLDIFFTVHDPTTVDRQGGDFGPQYRSVIFATPEQREIVEETIRDFESRHVWSAPIVTEIRQPSTFHPAEHYHQDYFARNRAQPYCRIVIEPKVAKLRRQFMEKLQSSKGRN